MSNALTPRLARGGDVSERTLSTPPLKLHVLRSGQRSAVEPIWRELEIEFGRGGLSTSWIWTSAWLNHYGDLVAHRFVVAEHDGAPVGVILITNGRCVRRGPLTLRSLHLGTAGEPYAETVRVEYNRMLVDPAHLPAFARAMVRQAPRLAAVRPHLLMLDGFEADDFAVLRAAAPALRIEEQPTFITDLSALRESGRSLLQGLKRKPAAKIRSTNAKLESSFGPLTVEWAESLDQALDIFAELKALHTRRWERAGQSGVFASARFTAFHHELIERLFPRGAVLLARVKAGSITVGCDYAFIERNRVLGQQWGIAHFEDSRLSPGLAVAAAVTQAALERGFAEKDWMAGDVLYKRELSTTRRSIYWAALPFGPVLPTLELVARIKRSIDSRLTRTGGTPSSHGDQ